MIFLSDEARLHDRINPLAFIALSLLPLVSHGQSDATVTYMYTSYGGYKTEMKLMIGKGRSRFIFHTDKTTLATDDGKEFYNYYSHNEDFYDFRTGRMVESRTLEDSTKLIAEWNNNLKWKITDEVSKEEIFRPKLINKKW